jgi:hypothetical protein
MTKEQVACYEWCVHFFLLCGIAHYSRGTIANPGTRRGDKEGQSERYHKNIRAMDQSLTGKICTHLSFLTSLSVISGQSSGLMMKKLFK